MNLMHDLDEIFAHIGYGLLVVPFVMRFAAAPGSARVAQPTAPARSPAP